MTPAQLKLQRIALYAACAAPVADMVSIAVSQSLIAVSIVLLLVSRTPLRVPPMWPAIALFMAGTLISWFASGNMRAGVPQIRKFYVWLILIAVYSAIRNVEQARNVWLLCGAAATVNSIWAIRQYVIKWDTADELGRDFYTYYVANRITGFQNHWMTFSGIEMMALLAIAALLFFAADRKMAIAILICGAIMLTGIVLSDTRSVWAAVALGGCFLVACWRARLLALVPVVLAVAYAAAPAEIQERVESIYKPHGTLDSNEHRRVTTVTGWEMIKAHPVLGLGPEMVGPNFNRYVPASVHRPLPQGFYGHLHSIYVHYAAERGIPTMLSLMWMLGWCLRDFLRGARATPRTERLRRAILFGASAVIIGTMVEGFFELNLGDSEPLAIFLSIMACGYVALLKRNEEVEVA